MLCYKNKMGIDFATETLRAIETEDVGSTNFPVSVIKAARKKLTLLRAACDAQSLRNWRSLDCETFPVEGSPAGLIRLNDQYRMAFEIHFDDEPQTITITSIESRH